MATGSRTLTLKLLADINNFSDGLDKSTAQTKTASDQIADFGKKAALAFAAIGAAALAYAKQAVEAAAADEAAQLKLATTIEATTNASSKQIAEVERWITTTSIAIGITDDELRPAFDRLVRSTNDVETAQRLLNLALDLQAATGKPLEAVTNALGKAYDGNTAALGKLGLGIDSSTLKSKDFNKIFTELDSTFGNFAEDTANSTQKGLERVKIALNEANESIGMALLPIVQDLTAWIMEHFIPALQAMIGGLTGDKSVLQSLNGTYEAFYQWGERIRNIINTVISLKDEIIAVAAVMATMFVASKIAAGVAATITTINLLIKAYNALKASAFVAGVASAFALNPLLGIAAGVAGTAAIIAATKFISGVGGGEEQPTGVYTGNPNLQTSPSASGGFNVPSISGTGISSGGGAKITAPFKPSTTDLYGNPVNPNTIYDPKVIAKINAQYGNVNPNFTGGVTINVSGAIDPEGTARTIVNTLNSSYYRGTGGAEGLVYAV